MSHKMTRRGLIAGSIVGAAGFVGLEERILLAAMQEGDPNAIKPPPANEAKIPTGKLGNLTISRMIMGGNLIGGWAHSRDLIYVSKLFMAYNTEEKVFQTLRLGEQYGINTIIIDAVQMVGGDRACLQRRVLGVIDQANVFESVKQCFRDTVRNATGCEQVGELRQVAK